MSITQPPEDGSNPGLGARLSAWAGRVRSSYFWLIPLAALIAVALKNIAITKSLLSFAAMYVEFAVRYGWLLGGLFLGQLALHEAGHFVVAQRRGFSPGWPIFIPFVGAYVWIEEGFQTREDEIDIAAAGPAWGLAAAFGLLLAGLLLNMKVFVFAASFGFILNLINLFPARPLDGGRILFRKPEKDARLDPEKDGAERLNGYALIAFVAGILLLLIGLIGRSAFLSVLGFGLLYAAFFYHVTTRARLRAASSEISTRIVPSRERVVQLTLWLALVSAHALGIYATAGAIRPP